MKLFKSIYSLNKNKIFKANTYFSKNFTFSKQFSTISLRTHQGTIQFSNQNQEKDISIRKNLSKNWILPKEELIYNTNISSIFNDNNEENTLISGLGKISQVEFDRFAVKTGLGISNSPRIYVNDFIVNEKKVRFITADEEATARFSALNGESTTFENADLLVYANNTEKSSARKFALYDKTKRVLLTNSQSLNSIKSAIEQIFA